MIRLDNPFLSASSLIQYFSHYIKEGNIPPGYKKQTNLKKLKNSLKRMYFPETDTNDVLTQLNSSPFFLHTPSLKNSLKIILSLPDDANPDDLAKAEEQLSQLPTPEEKESNNGFQRINGDLDYFEGSPEQITLFHKLVQICLTLYFCIEKYPHYSSSRDGVYALQDAQDIAYRLMWLWIDNPQEVISLEDIATRANTLFNPKQKDKTIQKPIQKIEKTLMLPNSRGIRDRKGWSQFINQTGMDGLPFVSKAVVMEKLNQDKAPTNLQEAHRLNIPIVYSRSQEDPELAELCYQYHLDATSFNTVLNFVQLKWPAKNSDELPDVIITGNEQNGTQGLTWSKLDRSDKRTLIIGNILSNCMHLNGKGKECVKSMATLPTNGLYVLRDAQGKILAGAYAWRSNSGNLCLDSIDCLPGIKENEEKEKALESILSQFAQEVLKTHPEINRVTMGVGAKTPHFSFPSAKIYEAIEQGCFYGDAKFQKCIAERSSSLSSEQQDKLHQILSSHSYEFQKCIQYLILHGPVNNELIPKLEQVLKTDPNLDQQLTQIQLKRLFSFKHKPTLNDLEPVNFDFLKLPLKQQLAILSEVSIPRMLWRMAEAIDNKTLEPNKTLLHFYCAMIESLPVQYRLEALETKVDSAGRTMLHYALPFPDIVQNMMRLYPEKSLSTVLRTTGYNDTSPSFYEAAMPYPKSLRILLTSDPSPITLSDLNSRPETFGRLLDAADYPESLTAILDKIPLEERNDAIDSQLRNIASNPTQDPGWQKNQIKLSTFLNALPKNEHVDIIKKLLHAAKETYVSTILLNGLQGLSLEDYPKVFSSNIFRCSLENEELAPLKEFLIKKLDQISGTDESIQALAHGIESARNLKEIAALIKPDTWKPQSCIEWLKNQMFGLRKDPKNSGPGPVP